MKRTIVLLAAILVATVSIAKSPRRQWVKMMDRIARPVVMNTAAGTLKANMPYESPDVSEERRQFSYLEALGRTICGIAPWLENEEVTDPAEKRLQAEYRECARKAIANAVDPLSPDYMAFDGGAQPLVDAAYLAEGLLRAPKQLWELLSQKDRDNLVEALKTTRKVKPYDNNWILFASQVEATLLEFTGQCDTTRMLYGVERFRDDFYKGDGMYGDGAAFHMDYYNSYVIHPMLLDVLEVMAGHDIPGSEFLAEERIRHTRYSAILERMISPEGTYPVLGRSITACRTGVFHCLAQDALKGTLPVELTPGGVRSAMMAVIRRQFAHKDTFDRGGWLRVGFSGSQPDMAESYVNTGSNYHCLTIFLPLGLPANDPFWTAPDALWSGARTWAGEPMAGDHAISN